MWDQFETHTKDISRDDFVKVQGRVELYRGKPQISLQQVRIANRMKWTLPIFFRTPKRMSRRCTPTCSASRLQSKIRAQQVSRRNFDDPKNRAAL